MSGKISQQTDGGKARSTDELPANRAGADRKLTAQSLARAPFAWNEYTDSHVIVTDDLGNGVVMDKATAVSLTINDEDSNFDPEPGDSILILQEGAGQVTVVAGAGVTLLYNAIFASRLNAQYAMATLVYRGANVWVLSGDLDLGT